MIRYSDNFNRADAGTLGTDYGNNDSLFKLASNTAQTGTGADVLERVTLIATWGKDQYSEATLGICSADGVGAGYGPACMCDTGGANTGVRVVGNASGYEVGHIAAGAFTSLNSGAGTTFAAGDRLRLRYNVGGVSGAWAVYKNFPSTAFASGTDASPLTTGNPGLAYSSIATATNSIDAWEAGEPDAAGFVLNRIRPSLPGSPFFAAWITRPKPIGTANTSVQYTQAVAGVLSFSGALSKTTLRSIAGGLSFAGALVKQANKVVAGGLSFAGALVKQTNKPLAGGLSFAGAVTFTRQYFRSFTGALSFSGALVNQTNKVIAGGLSFVGTVNKITAKSFAGALSFAGAIAKRANKVVAGSLSFAGALATSFIAGGTLYFQAIAGALSFNGALSATKNPIVTGITDLVMRWRRRRR